MFVKFRNILVIFSLLFSVFALHQPVYAGAGTCTNGITGKCNPICQSDADKEQKAAAGCTTDPNDNIGKHIERLINAGISLVGIIGVLVIAFAGQRFLVAGGDSGKVKQAKDMILWAVVGIIVAVLAWAIITFVLKSMPATAAQV